MADLGDGRISPQRRQLAQVGGGRGTVGGERQVTRAARFPTEGDPGQERRLGVTRLADHVQADRLLPAQRIAQGSPLGGAVYRAVVVRGIGECSRAFGIVGGAERQGRGTGLGREAGGAARRPGRGPARRPARRPGHGAGHGSGRGSARDSGRGAARGRGGACTGSPSPSRGGGGGGGGVTKHAVDQGGELELLEQRNDPLRVERSGRERVGVHVQLQVAIDGGQALRQQRLCGVGLDLLPLLALELVDAGDQRLHRPELGEQLLGGLLSHSGNAGDVVGAVAGEPEQVDHLLGALHPEPLAYRGHVEHHRRVTAHPRHAVEKGGAR